MELCSFLNVIVRKLIKWFRHPFLLCVLHCNLYQHQVVRTNKMSWLPHYYLLEIFIVFLYTIYKTRVLD